MLWPRLIGQRLREIRELKNLSQGEIERRTGFLRAFTLRIENGHSVPTIETLEKYARALEVPLHYFFYDGEDPPQMSSPPARKARREWRETGHDRREIRTFARAFARMDDHCRTLLMDLAAKMARRKRTR